MEHMMEKDPLNRISIDGIRVSDDVILHHQVMSCDIVWLGASMDKEEWYDDPQ